MNKFLYHYYTPEENSRLATLHKIIKVDLSFYWILQLELITNFLLVDLFSLHSSLILSDPGGLRALVVPRVNKFLSKKTAFETLSNIYQTNH